MATLGDVAERAGVSVSTASRILSGNKAFSYREGTRQRVLQASRDLGYTPNLPARALASGTSHIIGAAFPRVYDTPFTALFVQQILAGIEAACSRQGYHLLLSSPSLDDDGMDPAYARLLQSGYLDGVILHDDVAVGSILAPARARGVPSVVLGHRDHPHFVRADDVAGGRQLMAHVLELGHRRIGIVALAEGAHLAVDARVRGMEEAARSRGVPFARLPRADGGLSREGGARAAGALLREHPDLTALVCANDRMAIGALRTAAELGYRVPDDLTVTGYDDLPLAAEITPPLTTVDQRAQEWGPLAVGILLALLRGEAPDPVTLPTSLVVRATSAPPKGV